MKRLFSILVLVLSFSALFAQQTTVALLNHEGTITTYYGSEALIQAHKAAVHGDVITLSGGTFDAPSEWIKAVTVRGAGCYQGADNSRDVTSINGKFLLKGDKTIETATIFEGLNFKADFNYSVASNGGGTFPVCLKNVTFLKCYFKKMASIGLNTNFYNCIIEEISFAASKDCNANINMFNCYVVRPQTINQYCSTKMINCIINCHEYSTSALSSHTLYNDRFQCGSCSNCIFIGNMKSSSSSLPSDYSLSTNSTAKNCLSCFCIYTPTVDNDVETIDAVYDYNIFENMGGNASSNSYLTEGKPITETIKSVFKTYNGTDAFSFNEFYELTDEAKATYIGTDGTQIGIHGGIGFDLIPSTLQITKCEIAPRSTSDGKLSVSIEVGIPE